MRQVRKKKSMMHWFLLLSLIFCSCSSEDEEITTPYDAGKPITISDFTPKKGGGQMQMIIYGSNFGTDPKLISVKVGGKDALVISAKGTSLYCVTPNKCYEGTVEVSIGESKVTAKDKYAYERQKVVTTVYGHKDERGHYDVADGTFEESFVKNHGLLNPTWLSFDPKSDNKILYLAQDGQPMRVIDLENKRIGTGLTNTGTTLTRMRTIAWTAKGDTMVLANDGGGPNDRDENFASSVFVTRENQFMKDVQVLAIGKQCNGAAVHPVNQELYYNNFTRGNLYRYDYLTYGAGVEASTLYREFICTIQDSNWEFNITMHPSGDYAYLVVKNQHYIMRMNYNWESKTFGTPYLICGGVGDAGWLDGVGASARLSSPYQGTFVKNPDYVAQGREDQYDFYFCDRDSHAIRVLTPEGIVSTFAGRGSTSVDGKPEGYINGAIRADARFNKPVSLAYDEKHDAFYIGEAGNNLLRKIALEELEGEPEEEN